MSSGFDVVSNGWSIVIFSQELEPAVPKPQNKTAAVFGININ